MPRPIALLTALAMVAATLCAAFLMARGAGLMEGLDFGCGQYYYTDIPDWITRFAATPVNAGAPPIAYALALLGWGALAYWIWLRVDRLGNND